MSSMKPLRVGLLGFGVVGRGTWTVLTRNSTEIARRAGRHIQIVHIATRSPNKARETLAQQGIHNVRIDDDVYGLVNDPSIDIVIELIGGTSLAKDLVLQAIANGKHVVTANKALLALHGNHIFAQASQAQVMVAFEAAVAGGIPIIKAIRESLTANRIQWLAGIINGTTNFILSQMREQGLSFEQALAQAQSLGYAEADPTFDIQGIDAAHKLTLLASIAFGIPVQFDHVHIEGITQVSPEDVSAADRLGYRLKLLGLAMRRDSGIELRVHPCLVPKHKLIANVEGAMNAVVVKGDAVGETLYYGAGAGSEPTASAVVADVVDVTRLHTADPEHRVPHLAFQADALADYPILPRRDYASAYYLRMTVQDQPGVMAEIATLLAKHHISIDAMTQDSRGQDSARIIFLTHRAQEGHVLDAIAQIEALPTVQSTVTCLRMETLS